MKRISGGRNVISRLLILAGLFLVLGALAFEAYHYPWRALFGGNDQSEASVPDPAPIVLKGEDRESVIVPAEPEASPDASPAEAPETDVLPGDETAEALPEPAYVQLGILKIPKLGVSEYVLEGTQRQMRYGVGHVEESAGIGQKGNCAIAGHRPAPFRYLDKLDTEDSVILKADDTVYTYSVYESFTVLPDETWVLGAAKGEAYALTLITCTPYLVSSHRLIVRARLIDINGMTPEVYYGEASAPPVD